MKYLKYVVLVYIFLPPDLQRLGINKDDLILSKSQNLRLLDYYL